MRIIALVVCLWFSHVGLADIDDMIITDIPLAEISPSDKQPILIETSNIGTTQFLVLSALIDFNTEGQYFSVFKRLAQVRGGKWKHQFTVWQSGRALQVWHRHLDKELKHHGKIKIKAKHQFGLDLKLIEIPEKYQVGDPKVYKISEPGPLYLELVGKTPFLVFAAVNNDSISTESLFSYGWPVKTHIYKADAHLLHDPSIGPIMGVAGAVSLQR